MTSPVMITFLSAGWLLNVAGIAAPAILPCNELTLFFGLIIYICGSLLSLYATESCLTDGGFSPRLSLLSFLSIPGSLLLYAIVKRKTEDKKKTEDTTPLFTPFADPKNGILFTVFLSILIIGGVGILIGDGVRKNELLTGHSILKNELYTYRNVKEIITAQQHYKETDWDKDSVKSYARFIPHLYQSVDRNANPIPVNLLRKPLAFADKLIRSIDGYYYISLYENSNTEIDYTKQWAAIAVPLHYDATGRYIFLFNHTGKIYVKDFPYDDMTKIEMPFSPDTEEWDEISAENKLKELQSKREKSLQTNPTR